MSVGLQRLRDEPDLLRRATADKGEDRRARRPRAGARRAAPAACSARRMPSRPSATTQAARSARRCAAAPIADGAGGRRAQGGVDRASPSASRPSMRSWPRSRPSSTTRCCASRTRPTRRAGRRRGGERHGPHAGASRCHGRHRRPHWELAEPLGHHRQRARREDHRLRVGRSTSGPDRTCSAP